MSRGAASRPACRATRFRASIMIAGRNDRIGHGANSEMMQPAARRLTIEATIQLLLRIDGSTAPHRGAGVVLPQTAKAESASQGRRPTRLPPNGQARRTEPPQDQRPARLDNPRPRKAPSGHSPFQAARKPRAAQARTMQEDHQGHPQSQPPVPIAGKYQSGIGQSPKCTPVRPARRLTDDRSDDAALMPKVAPLPVSARGSVQDFHPNVHRWWTQVPQTAPDTWRDLPGGSALDARPLPDHYFHSSSGQAAALDGHPERNPRGCPSGAVPRRRRAEAARPHTPRGSQASPAVAPCGPWSRDEAGRARRTYWPHGP
jgi:hypothetical protein